MNSSDGSPNGPDDPGLPDPPLEVDPETVEARRLSFGVVAGEYNRFRPTYPSDAVTWAIGGEPQHVLDLGAGTGAMTRVLLELGFRVTAVEPDAEMRRQLHSTVGADARVVPGSAEDIPLAAGSVDAIVVAQAFHWFKLDVALPQMHRVLKSEGRLCVVWNRRDDDVGWVEEMSKIVGRHDARSGSRDTSLDDVSPYFDEPEGTLFRHAARLNKHSLVGLVDTYSYVRLSPDRGRILTAIAELAADHPDLQDKQTFELPYETVTYRAQRLTLADEQR